MRSKVIQSMRPFCHFILRAPRSALLLFTLGITFVNSSAAQLVTSLAPMIERVSPAVVNISVSGSVDVDNPLTNNPFFS